MKKNLLIVVATLTSLLSRAQTACDSLDLDVKYAAFSDSLIEVSVTNHGSAFYSYPGFIIYNSNGDTVAKEEVVFFGIGGQSNHVLKLYPGMGTSSAFNGVLQLWSGFYSTLECSYTRSFSLCPDTCVQIYPYMGNMGGAMSAGTVNWTLQDSLSTIVASGTFVLDSLNQMDEDTVCINKGSYSLHVSGAPGPLGGQPYFGVTNHFMSPSPQKQYLGAADQVAFSFYKNCPVVTGIRTPNGASGLMIYQNGGVIEIRTKTGAEVGAVDVYAASGQVVWSGRVEAEKERIDLSYLPSGLYIVQVSNKGQRWHDKVIIVK